MRQVLCSVKNDELGVVFDLTVSWHPTEFLIASYRGFQKHTKITLIDILSS